MSSSGIIEFCDRDEIGGSNGENVRKGPNSVSGTFCLKRKYKIEKLQLLKSEKQSMKQKSMEDRSSNAFNIGQTNSTVLDQGDSPVDESSLSSAGPIGPAPITRQFWKAGDYDSGQGSHTAVQSGKNYLRIHPMFLHSNATSHEWVFDAIAELLDDAVDKVDYEFNTSAKTFEAILPHGKEHFSSNLSILMQWSP